MTSNDFTVLVASSNQRTRLELYQILSLEGFRVVLANDGAEAVEKYRAAHLAENPFDAVLMDLTIPGGLGGREAVAELRSFDPRVKVVVSSGYSQDPVMANYQKYGFVDVLPKPFMITKLGHVLKRVLSAESSGE